MFICFSIVYYVKVIQVCKKDTKKIYAMKGLHCVYFKKIKIINMLCFLNNNNNNSVMNKSIIVQKNDTEHIKAERRILEKVFF